jgi:hypothetical protein
MIALAVGPRVPDKDQRAHCVVNVHLRGPFGLSLNCDSPEFMRLALAPQHLFDPQNERQSRPGLIAAAALLVIPLMPLSSAAQWFSAASQREDIDPQRVENALAAYPPAFVAYVLLNIAVLLAAFYFFERAAVPDSLRDAYAGLVVLATGLLLIGNGVVKVFAWSPHTQMFNILVPVLGVYLALRAGASQPSRSFVIWMALATGFGITAYALFVVLVPCFVLPLVWRCLRDPRERARKRLVDAVIFCTLAAAPFTLWYVLVLVKTGSFYQHEIAQGQLTWMGDAYAADGVGGVIGGLLLNLTTLGRMALVQALALGATAAWVLAYAACRGGLSELAARSAAPLAAGVLVTVLIAGFYASTGLMAPRLAYALLPSLLVVTAVAAVAVATRLAPSDRRVFVSGCFAIAAVQIGMMIHEYPPLW